MHTVLLTGHMRIQDLVSVCVCVCVRARKAWEHMHNKDDFCTRKLELSKVED
jgi:hypothetical protein